MLRDITGQPCHWGKCVQRPGPPGWELDARLATLIFKEDYCCEIQRRETGWCNSWQNRQVSLAESSEECYGSERAVLPKVVVVVEHSIKYTDSCYRPPHTVHFCHALGTTFLSNHPLPGCWWTSLITDLPFPVMLFTFSVLSMSREKSGVAGFGSVMVVMSSYLRLITGLARAGQEDPQVTVTYTTWRLGTFSNYLLNSTEHYAEQNEIFLTLWLWNLYSVPHQN
jgi:hypothetical protein